MLVDPMGVGKVVQFSDRIALDLETRLHAWNSPQLKSDGTLDPEKYEALVVLLREKSVLREAKGIQQFNFSQGRCAADDKPLV